MQLLPKLHHPPFLRRDGPKKIVAIVIDVEGDRSPSRECWGRASRRLEDGGHGSGGGNFGVRGGGWRLVEGEVDGEVQCQAFGVSSPGVGTRREG